MKPENIKRANRARKALADYKRSDPHAELSQHLYDLLSDVRHLCDLENLSFDEVCRVSYGHYCAELQGQ